VHVLPAAAGAGAVDMRIFSGVVSTISEPRPVSTPDTFMPAMPEGPGGDMPFDCFTGGGKVVFYKAGSFTPFSYDFEINNDGTLQTPLGAIKKMGN
jgi:hypothetical protein